MVHDPVFGSSRPLADHAVVAEQGLAALQRNSAFIWSMAITLPEFVNFLNELPTEILLGQILAVFFISVASFSATSKEF
jgi:hypothetical protein